MGLKVAVVGATGNVGRQILSIIEERGLPCEKVVALSMRQSKGQKIGFGDKVLTLESVDEFDFSTVDIAFFAIGATQSKTLVPRAANAGAIVIDNSSLYRMDPNVPLIVPEVNPHHLKNYTKKNIIANPNCTTAAMLLALKPLHDVAKIKRVVVSTYQSVSGAGQDAMNELFNQTRAILVNDPVAIEQFTKQIAHNVIPHIDDFMEDGSTKEEWKMVAETHKILDSDIEVSATAVRVPVFVGHAMSLNVEFKKPLSHTEARNILREAPGCAVVDKREDGGYITPIECVGEFDTYISRIRKDPTIKHGLNMWVVSDNLRKGAALNAVQIAESLIEQGYVKP